MKVPPSACPTCHELNDAATDIDNTNATPKEGDLSVCLNCGEIMVFNADRTTRAVALNDLTALPPEIHAQLDRVQQTIRKLRPPDRR